MSQFSTDAFIRTDPHLTWPFGKMQGGVISEFGISYINWDQITGVIRLITFRADNTSARDLLRPPYPMLSYGPMPI